MSYWSANHDRFENLFKIEPIQIIPITGRSVDDFIFIDNVDFALKSLGAGLSPSITEYLDPDQVKYRQGHSFRVNMTKNQSHVSFKRIWQDFTFK